MNEAIEYPYKQKISRTVLLILIAGAVGIRNAYLAHTNVSGMTLFGMLKFGAEGATIFRWVSVVVMAGWAILGVIHLLSIFMSDDETKIIRLTSNEIYIPQGFFRKKVRVVRFDDITGINMRIFGSKRVLILELQDKKIGIGEICLPDREAFDRVCAFIIPKTGKQLV